MVMASMKDLLDAFDTPAVGDWAGLRCSSISPTLKHYYVLFAENNFGVYLFNSLVASLGSALVAVTLGSMAAYSLARMEFRGKKDLLFWIISTRMAPMVAVTVPLYAIFRSLILLGHCRVLSWPSRPSTCLSPFGS